MCLKKGNFVLEVAHKTRLDSAIFAKNAESSAESNKNKGLNYEFSNRRI